MINVNKIRLIHKYVLIFLNIIYFFLLILNFSIFTKSPEFFIILFFIGIQFLLFQKNVLNIEKNINIRINLFLYFSILNIIIFFYLIGVVFLLINIFPNLDSINFLFNFLIFLVILATISNKILNNVNWFKIYVKYKYYSLYYLKFVIIYNYILIHFNYLNGHYDVNIFVKKTIAFLVLFIIFASLIFNIILKIETEKKRIIYLNVLLLNFIIIIYPLVELKIIKNLYLNITYLLYFMISLIFTYKNIMKIKKITKK